MSVDFTNCTHVGSYIHLIAKLMQIIFRKTIVAVYLEYRKLHFVIMHRTYFLVMYKADIMVVVKHNNFFINLPVLISFIFIFIYMYSCYYVLLLPGWIGLAAFPSLPLLNSSIFFCR